MAILLTTQLALEKLQLELKEKFSEPFPMYRCLMNRERFSQPISFFVDAWPSYRVVIARIEMNVSVDYFVLFVSSACLQQRYLTDSESEKATHDPANDLGIALKLLLSDDAVVDWKKAVIFDYVDRRYAIMVENEVETHAKIQNVAPWKVVYTVFKDNFIEEPEPLGAMLKTGIVEHDPELQRYLALDPSEFLESAVYLHDPQCSILLVRQVNAACLPRCVAFAQGTLLGDVVIRRQGIPSQTYQDLFRQLMYSCVAKSFLDKDIQPTFTLAVTDTADSFLLNSLGFRPAVVGGRILTVRGIVSFPLTAALYPIVPRFTACPT